MDPVSPSPRTCAGVHRAAGATKEAQGTPPAAEWTPEQVRSDGEGVHTYAFPSTVDLVAARRAQPVA